MTKLDVPARSFVYYALCELEDALDNLHDVRSLLDDDRAKSLVDDFCNDISMFISDLHQLSL